VIVNAHKVNVYIVHVRRLQVARAHLDHREHASAAACARYAYARTHRPVLVTIISVPSRLNCIHCARHRSSNRRLSSTHLTALTLVIHPPAWSSVLCSKMSSTRNPLRLFIGVYTQCVYRTHRRTTSEHK
jgi:hypothetical protein